jgi:hypothetical protein
LNFDLFRLILLRNGSFRAFVSRFIYFKSRVKSRYLCIDFIRFDDDDVLHTHTHTHCVQLTAAILLVID